MSSLPSKAMTTITLKEYFARDGSVFSNKDAQKIGPVLHELSQQGGVTARDVVDAARSENSPLHSYFQWNDKVAADEFRLWRARDMLGSIKIRYIEKERAADGTEKTITREARAFQVTRTAPHEPEPRKYRTFQVLHGDSAFAAQMMDSAFDDLIGWRRKYEPYVQIWKNFGDTFQAVVNQISEWEEEFPVEQAAPATDDALLALLSWRETNMEVLQTWTSCREQIEFIMQAIRDAEATFATLNEKKHRDCIKCGKSFVSFNAGHRMCPRCLNSKTVNERSVDAIGAKMIGSG